MLKSCYPHIALALIGVLYLLFGPRQLFFQLCHQMKIRNVVAAPESLYFESIADNFYKAVFFQLNTYKLINHCQPRTWNYYKPFEFIKSAISTLIKGCSDLDSALIKDLGGGHTTHLHVAFQQKLLGQVSSKSTLSLSLFFFALFFKDVIQAAAISVCNKMSNDYRQCYDNMIAENDNNNNSGNNGGRGGPSGNSVDGPGHNDNTLGSTKIHYSKGSSRPKHIPIPKKPAEQEASSSKKSFNVASSSKGPSSSKAPYNTASTSKAPSNISSALKDSSSPKAPSNVALSSKDSSSSKPASSSDTPNSNTEKPAIEEALKEYHQLFVQLQASFADANSTKERLQQSLTRYQGLVNSLNKDYNLKPDIPLPDTTSPTVSQYVATQQESGAKLRDTARVKGKSTPLLDNLTNHLRISKLKTDELEKKLYEWKFDREALVLRNVQTLSQVPPAQDTLLAPPFTAPPPVPESPASFVDSPTWSQLQEQQQQQPVKPESPYPYPKPNPYTPGTKNCFRRNEEAKEYLKNHPVFEPTFEDVDNANTPFKIPVPPKDYENYRFPPGEYIGPEAPTTSATLKVYPEAPSAQKQVPRSSKSKGKQPMYPRA